MIDCSKLEVLEGVSKIPESNKKFFITEVKIQVGRYYDPETPQAQIEKELRELMFETIYKKT